MKNETELKTEKEKNRILIHPQWGKGNYIQVEACFTTKQL